MTVCPHTYGSIRGGQGYDNGNYIVTKDDLGRDLDPCMSGGDSPCHYHLGAISVDHSYIIFQAQNRRLLSSQLDRFRLWHA